MLKKICQIICICALICISNLSYAQRSSYNPMQPRNLNEKSFNQDRTYGYSLLVGNAIDTFETPNRYAGWNLNYHVFDIYLLRPLAHSYAKLPQGVQSSIGNFVYNLDSVNSIFNYILLGDIKNSAISLSRFTINSTVGILGFFDVAKYMGLENKNMTMATVLGRAKMDAGEFFMVPGYGPTTTRDVQGDLVDDTPYMFLPWYVGIIKWAIAGIHSRAQVIPQEQLIDEALDPYNLSRDIYLQYQQGQIDPNASMENDDSNLDNYLNEIDDQ